MTTKAMTLNEKLKIKIEATQQLKPTLTSEAYAENLLQLKKKYFKKLVNPDYCELDLSQFEKLNSLIEDAYEVLINQN